MNIRTKYRRKEITMQHHNAIIIAKFVNYSILSKEEELDNS